MWTEFGLKRVFPQISFLLMSLIRNDMTNQTETDRLFRKILSVLKHHASTLNAGLSTNPKPHTSVCIYNKIGFYKYLPVRAWT